LTALYTFKISITR